MRGVYPKITPLLPFGLRTGRATLRPKLGQSSWTGTLPECRAASGDTPPPRASETAGRGGRVKSQRPCGYGRKTRHRRGPPKGRFREAGGALGHIHHGPPSSACQSFTRAPHSHRYASQRNQTGQQLDSRDLLFSMSSLRSPAAVDLGSSRVFSSLIRPIRLKSPELPGPKTAYKPSVGVR